MKLYDCFMFYDETMLLEIRLNILNKFVDKFVIAEAKYLHNGREKKLNFDIKNFNQFKNKIEYIVVNEDPKNLSHINPNDSPEVIDNKKIINSLNRENFQREELMRGLKNINDDDVILLSDLDEIPNLNNFKVEKVKNNILIFKQMMFYYKFNLYYENFKWFGSKAVSKKNFISPQWLRNIKNKKYPKWRFDTFFSDKKYNNVKFIEDGGWHFTCIKDPKDIHFKLSSFLHHQDYENSNISVEDLERKISNRELLYDHNQDQTYNNKWKTQKKLKKVGFGYLPDFLDIHRVKYKKWIEN